MHANQKTPDGGQSRGSGRSSAQRGERPGSAGAGLEGPGAAHLTKEAALEFLASIPDGGQLSVHLASQFSRFFPNSELGNVIVNAGAPAQIVKVYNFLSLRKEGEPITGDYFRFSVQRNPNYRR